MGELGGDRKATCERGVVVTVEFAMSDLGKGERWWDDPGEGRKTPRLLCVSALVDPFVMIIGVCESAGGGVAEGGLSRPGS